MLQQAALQAGLQIQQAGAGQLKVFGANNAVHVSQAETTVTQFWALLIDERKGQSEAARRGLSTTGTVGCDFTYSP
jgi:hypothetical protein